MTKIHTPQIWIMSKLPNLYFLDWRPVSAGFCILCALKYNRQDEFTTTTLETVRDLMLAGV